MKNSAQRIRHVFQLAAWTCAVACSAQGFVPAIPDTTVTPVVSTIPLVFAPPQPNQWHTLPANSHTAYPILRGYAVGDFNGDGRLDLVLCPMYYSFQPQLPLVVLLNQGNGVFADGTASVIEGPVPTCGSPNNMFVRDFNGDGRPDIFMVDQGAEYKDPNNPGFDGAPNLVLLSQPNGKLRDVTSTSLPGQTPEFNHVSSMGDLNGDGAIDIVITRLGGPVVIDSGLMILMNDGTGRFTPRPDLLPPEIAQHPSLQQGIDYLFAGSNGVGDLDGDGKLDIVSASYGADYPSGRRTVRMYRQQAGGNFSERARTEIPASIAGIPYFEGTSVVDGRGGLGASGVYIADFNGDGRNDVLVIWEGTGPSYFQFLRNDGNFTFTDVTLAWWGGYQSHTDVGGFKAAAMLVEIRDFNGDGVPDLFIRRGYTDVAGLNPSTMLYLNDGSGKFTPWRWQMAGAAATTQQLTAAISQIGPFSMLHMDVDGDGIEDPVYLRYLHDYSVSPTVSKGFEVRTYRSSYAQRAGTAVKDLWWAGTAENGWGMSITQHRDTLFSVFYVYDAQGNPVWYVMPGGAWNAGHTTYSGPLFLTRGAPFSAYNSSQLSVANVGTASITFNGNSSANVAFTINGISGSKSITKQPIATGSSLARYDDLWWGGTAENGWGINITQQANTLFSVWYTYDATGAARWYVMPGGSWAHNKYAGRIYTTRSSSWLGAPYQASSLVATDAGSMTFTFLDENTALMSYNIGGIQQVKPIFRQSF